MAGFKFERFRGEIPKLGDRVIDGRTATVAEDCRLDSGEVQPLMQELAVQAFSFDRTDWHDFRAYDDTGATARLPWSSSNAAYDVMRYSTATPRAFVFDPVHTGAPVSNVPLLAHVAPAAVLEHAEAMTLADTLYDGPFFFPRDGEDHVLELSIPGLSGALNYGWVAGNEFLFESGNFDNVLASVSPATRFVLGATMLSDTQALLLYEDAGTCYVIECSVPGGAHSVAAWNLLGEAIPSGAGYLAVAALSATAVVLFTTTEMRLYIKSAGTWNLSTTQASPFGATNISSGCALSSTRIAVVDDSGAKASVYDCDPTAGTPVFTHLATTTGIAAGTPAGLVHVLPWSATAFVSIYTDAADAVTVHRCTYAAGSITPAAAETPFSSIPVTYAPGVMFAAIAAPGGTGVILFDAEDALSVGSPFRVFKADYDSGLGSWAVDSGFDYRLRTGVRGASRASATANTLRIQPSSGGRIPLPWNWSEYATEDAVFSSVTTVEYFPAGESFNYGDIISITTSMFQRELIPEQGLFRQHELALSLTASAGAFTSEPAATLQLRTYDYAIDTGLFITSSTVASVSATLVGVDMTDPADATAAMSARVYFEYDAGAGGYNLRLELDGGAAAVNASSAVIAAGSYAFPETFSLVGGIQIVPRGGDNGHTFSVPVRLNLLQEDFVDTYSEPTMLGLLDHQPDVNLRVTAPGVSARDFFELRGVTAGETNGTERAMWVFTNSPSEFLGDPLRNDIYGRFYWVEEANGLRVDSLDDVFAEYGTLNYEARPGNDVGVPPAGEVLTYSAATKHEPHQLTLDITHAGVLKIPGYTGKALATTGAWANIDSYAAPNERHAILEQSDITVPDSYFLVIRTDREDYEPPRKNAQFWRTFNNAQWSQIRKAGIFDTKAYTNAFLGYWSLSQNRSPAKGIRVGLDGLVLAQPWVFHPLPDGSDGFHLEDDAAGSFASLTGLVSVTPAPTVWDSRYAAFQAVSAEQPDTTGMFDENSLTLTRAGGGDSWLHWIRFTSLVEQFPPTWHITHLFGGGTGFDWASRPATFEPVLLTDPRRIFSSEIYEAKGLRVYGWDVNSDKDRLTHMTFTWEGEVEPTYGFTEAFLNSLFVFEIDQATYNALLAQGAPELLAGTHFTAKVETRGVLHGTIGVRWIDLFGDVHTSPLKLRSTPEAGVGRARINQSLDSPSYDVTYQTGNADIGDVFSTVGPVVIDATAGAASIDWGAIEYPTAWSPAPAGGAYIARDPIDATSGSFDPLSLSTRDIAITLVNQYGEEGQPLLLEVEYYTDYPRTPVDLFFEKNSALLQQYGVTKVRLYRLDAAGVYYLQSEKEIAGLEDDALLLVPFDPGGPLNTAFPLISIDHDVPPAGVTTAIMHPAGFLLLGAGNTLAPSKLGYNFAYPLEYRLTIPERVVGFGQYGDTIVCLTDARPYLITGSTPENLQLSPVDLQQGCISQRTIVEIDGDVVFASPDGIYSVGRSGVRALTEELIGDRLWREYSDVAMHGYNWRGEYLLFYPVGSRYAALGINPRELERGVIHYTIDRIAGFRRNTDGKLFLFDGADITEWDAGSAPYTWTWKTKVLQGVFPKNPGRIRVNADTYPVTLDLWSDGQHIVQNWSIVDDEPYALPSGYLEYEFELQVQGTGRLFNVDVGETTFDLKQL